MKKKTIRIVTSFLLAVAALCGFFYLREYGTAQEEISEYASVRDEYTKEIYAPDPAPGKEGAPAVPSETDGLPYVEADFDALLLENPDAVGWLAVPNTAISYPVAQGRDNETYLNISFAGRRSNTGTPFADKDNDLRALDSNTVIYGHNMGAGRQDMFGSLLAYKDYGYYMAHRHIQFDTVYRRHGWWKIFAVIEYDTRLQAFDSLQLRFAGGDDFMAWAEQAKALSLYEADTKIPPDGHVLTLSTCDRSRYGKSGRILILAVKMDEARS